MKYAGVVKRRGAESNSASERRGGREFPLSDAACDDTRRIHLNFSVEPTVLYRRRRVHFRAGSTIFELLNSERANPVSGPRELLPG